MNLRLICRGLPKIKSYRGVFATKLEVDKLLGELMEPIPKDLRKRDKKIKRAKSDTDADKCPYVYRTSCERTLHPHSRNSL